MYIQIGKSAFTLESPSIIALPLFVRWFGVEVWVERCETKRSPMFQREKDYSGFTYTLFGRYEVVVSRVDWQTGSPA